MQNRKDSETVAVEAGESFERVEISVVIPVFNERDSLEELHSRLSEVLAQLNRNCEVIFVDDGSTDGSFQVLERLHQQDDRVRVLRLRRNFGQTAAFSAGFDTAGGQIIITLDADLQNDPQDIPRLLETLGEGYDVVSGWRHPRRDPLLSRRLPSRLANLLISLITGVKLHDYGCSLKAYRREVLENLQLYGEMHRFIPALASWMGIEVTEIKVSHAARRFGHSKYGMGRVAKVILDLLTVKFLLDFSTRPIQVFGSLGALFAAAGSLIGIYLSVLKLLYRQDIADRPLLLLAILLMVLGVQFVTMGLLGELVARVYHEAQKKPTYVVKEKLWRNSEKPERS